MGTFARRPKASRQTAPSESTQADLKSPGQSRRVKSIRHFLHEIGNPLVQRLFQANAEELGTPPSAAASTRFSHRFRHRQPTAPPKKCVGIQPKLMVNTPGDPYEREADRIADHVMKMPEHRVQRACPSGGGPAGCGQGHGDSDQIETGTVRQNGIGETEVPPIVRKTLDSPGQALDPGTRAFMEPRFGRDFSGVRVHKDDTATLSARAVNALAFTAGEKIVFAKGAYSPETNTGKTLIAHELAHVLQQNRAGTDLSETDRGGGVTIGAVPGPAVQRTPDGAFAAVTLSAIRCLIPDDFHGDEVYITVNGQQVWGPVSMDRFDIEPINRQIEFTSGPLVVRVYDQEMRPLSDDLIGTVSIPMPTTEEEIRRAPGSALLTTNGAYQLYFQVHRV